MIVLRPHQLEAINDETSLRSQGHRNVLVVLPTGAGKSLTLAEYAKRDYQSGRKCIVFAHRDRLILQLSEALCKMGVPHNFIASKKAIKEITNRNHVKFGDSFFDSASPITVSSNPTFAARVKAGKVPAIYLNSVYRWIQDEAHHATRNSETWGTCLSSFPNAIGLGFTATPLRNDKQGLGDFADGFFDAMSVTTTMWDLIVKGMLSPYKVYIPPVRIDRDKIKSNGNGDFTQASAAKETDKKEVTGDAVDHYLKLSPGQPAITFCVNIAHAKHVADEFNSRGVPSVAISSKDSLEKIDKAMTDFESGAILNLVNVDLLGEGYDSPMIINCIMLRPTQSYSLFKQQIGRVLRTAEGKSHGIIQDHVGNVNYMMRKYNLQYLHDDPEWSLDRESKRKKNDDGKTLEPWIVCPNKECGFQYLESEHGKTCPECGHAETVAETQARIRDMQSTDDELVELEVDAIQHLLQERAKIDTPTDVFSRKLVNMSPIVRNSAASSHAKRQHAQTRLRAEIQRWCSECYRSNRDWTVELVQREFSRVFGVHVLQAQTLGERKAIELMERIKANEYA